MIRCELVLDKADKRFGLLLGKVNEVNRGMIHVTNEQAIKMINLFKLRRNKRYPATKNLIYFTCES